MKKKHSKETKYIIVSGGVLSGLGKGIAAASIGRLLSDNIKVVPIKCDGYLNTDPGTMNPIEHGEVFVLDDGGEVDMDFGHYERFLNVDTKSEWNLTMGKVFQKIVLAERKGKFLGKTVQFIPHVTDAIKSWFKLIIKKETPDILLIEVGGTIGDLENQFYVEAIRQLKREIGKNMIHIHLTYVPIPSGVGEQKSKPTQMSVRILNEQGIEPDIIIGRCTDYLNKSVKEKIASYCNISPKAVISGIDVKTIYENPLVYQEEGIVPLLKSMLDIKFIPRLSEWQQKVETLKFNLAHKEVRVVKIALCGKYTALEDSYASIIESLVHCEAYFKIKIKVVWVDTEKVEHRSSTIIKQLQVVDCVIIPGGFGHRGIEGKIKIINYVREHKIPFLGICYGMQLAVIEFARSCCGLKKANTIEAQELPVEESTDSLESIITILDNQKNVSNKGGTMRLGGQDVLLKKGTKAFKLFGNQDTIRCRFRHRYEVNLNYISLLQEKGLVFSGTTPDGKIMQMIELNKHPYFIGCQFHPELTSSLTNPSPVFLGLIKSALGK